MIPECQHVLPGGKKCRAIALRGKTHCHHHSPTRKRHAPRPYRLRQTALLGPLPELSSHDAVQQVISQTVHALANGDISVCRAQVLITSLQLAAKTL
ncbi:hypothetical protein H7849_16470 [Alloacidobacterium dinghuense]|uniref:Uncharacterized protein n=1 Tax=Alloacidobacterium dinghuense TaxID=2763107 RepID=A0A7G8BDU5_9BACT|nr:hypothetical protein [Alloacidobacterium dinghuense]QNI30715.1 hypothetical protein H7849_16470 [Alloacidobacterium dinghuense]